MNPIQKLPKLDLRRLPLALVVLIGTACTSAGPSKIPPDQFSYNQAIGKASNEQMLLNLIRLRYRDVPVFLAVNSVLTQYIYSTNANVTGSLGQLQNADANSVTAGVGARYAERPTITYSPLSGEDFADQLMTPIPGELIFSLMHSGWPVVDIMAMSMERIGGERNPSLQGMLTEEGQEQCREFRELAALMIRVALGDGLELVRGVGSDGAGQVYLVFASDPDPETSELIDELRRRLGLSGEVRRYRVTRNRIERGERDITMRVRSLLDLMGFLSGGVEIPLAHFDAIIHTPTAPEEAARDLIPLRIRSGPELPEHTFVSANYQGQWFWIDSADEESKESFSLVTYLFLMMAPTPEGTGPLLTVPAG